MKLYGRHTSYNVQKVLWALDELDLPFEHTNLGGAYGGLNNPAFLAMNPNGKVPVLDDNGVVVWESHAIVRYLAARYGSGSLWAEKPAQRAVADQWMDWAANNFLPSFITLFWSHYRTPEPQRDAKRIESSLASCAQHLRVLDGQLAATPFVAGEQLTMGDIPAGTALFRYFGMGIEVDQPPHVMAWYERLLARPAYRARVAEPFDELKGRLDY